MGSGHGPRLPNQGVKGTRGAKCVSLKLHLAKNTQLRGQRGRCPSSVDGGQSELLQKRHLGLGHSCVNGGQKELTHGRHLGQLRELSSFS